MKVYLAKFVKNRQTAYKIGHTKWFKSIKRFESSEYDIFDDVSIIDDIYIEHEDASTARMCSELVEATLHGVFPKDFHLEKHFLTEENTFDHLSGITEFFILSDRFTEEDVVEIFRKAKKHITFVLRKYKK